MTLKGREIHLKMVQFLHYLKENCILQVFLFHSKVLPPYRKIELLKLLTVLFWIMQNFTSISRPFRPTVHQNDRNKIDLNLSKLSKTVRDLKFGQSLAIGPRQLLCAYLLQYPLVLQSPSYNLRWVIQLILIVSQIGRYQDLYNGLKII